MVSTLLNHLVSSSASAWGHACVHAAAVHMKSAAQLCGVGFERGACIGAVGYWLC
jgi:hypothetical protein